MKSLLASAPGKLVLCGEYAVLEGTPAISAAVNRRARVTLRETSDAAQIVVTTAGFEAGTYRYRSTGSGLEPACDQAALPLFESAWAAATIDPGAGLSIELDTEAFFSGPKKLGLGSSAALTVALVHALLTWQGDATRADVSSRLVHDVLQQGRGSGVDVATSISGGLIQFQRERSGNSGGAASDRISVSDIGWPEGLEAAVLFSGVAASTPMKLKRLDAQARRPVSDRLAAAAVEAAAAWQGGAVAAVLAATDDFVSSLADFSATYDLDVFGGGHSALIELAAKQGLVYKPCGAGGGDVGVVLGDTADRVAHFTKCAEENGFKLLDLDLVGSDVEGLTVEWMHD